MTNTRSQSRCGAESGLTVVELVVAGIFILILFGVLFLATQRVSSLLGTVGATTGRAFVGGYVVPPPPTLTASTTVTYSLVQRRVQIVGGSATTVGASTPFAGATLTFNIVGGVDATVNGSSTATVVTDAKGNASITLAPVRDGSGALTLNVTIGNSSFLEDSIQFEVDAP